MILHFNFVFVVQKRKGGDKSVALQCPLAVDFRKNNIFELRLV